LQPTYEEWKQLEKDRGVEDEKSLQPTYEEWKHISSNSSSLAIFRLQPTYEEWKPKNEAEISQIKAKFAAYL